ncbi:MAG TPA: hypothetical protein VGG40_00405 [Solirubrobacterales bacterium]|jgi:hypothetical protein
MRQTLKLACSILIAAALMAAPSAASASGFHSEVEKTFVYGQQGTANVLTTAAGNIQCKSTSFSATATGTGSGFEWTTSPLLLTPAYSSCTAFGKAATVSPNGCSFSLTNSSGFAGEAELSCEGGTTLTISVPSGNCSVVLEAQTPKVPSVGYASEGSGTSRNVTLTWKLSQIKYTVFGPGASCGTAGTYVGEEGASYTGTVSLKGYKDIELSEQVGIWTETPLPSNHFHSESSPTFLAGEQMTENIVTVNGGALKCTKQVFQSAEIIGTNWLTSSLAPELSGCTFIGQTATANTSGCKIVLTASSSVAGTMAISCEAGKSITYTANTSKCTVTIPAQEPGTPTISFTNEGSGATRTILVTWSVSGITYTSSGGACGTSGSNGKLSGTVKLKGYSNAGHTIQHGIWVE